MPSLHVIMRAFRCMSAHIRILHIKARKGGGTHPHTQTLFYFDTRADKLGSSSYGSTTTTLYPTRAHTPSVPSFPSLLLIPHEKEGTSRCKQHKGLSLSLFFLIFSFFFAVASIQWLSCKVPNCSRIRQTGIEKSETS